MKFLSEFKIIKKNIKNHSDVKQKLKNKIILVKFGGSAADREDNNNIFVNLCYLKWLGAIPVLVHGGGPVINVLLNQAGIKSKFIAGHRYTDEETINYVEMALKGKVNNYIVKQFHKLGYKAIGISGCDGFLIKAKKRLYTIESNGSDKLIDLGLVGDIDEINTDIINLLINNEYIPIIAPLAFGDDFNTYNINADIFAGNVAAEINADYYLSITDVDGLRADVKDEHSLITDITLNQLLDNFMDNLDGGMIPKIESCITALKNGVNEAYIINGKRKNIIVDSLLSETSIRTKITK